MVRWQDQEVGGERALARGEPRPGEVGWRFEARGQRRGKHKHLPCTIPLDVGA